MKYIDIQLTDKELWKQFQAKYQAGEYADALTLLQTLTPNSEVEGGYKGLIAKALNTLTDYIIRVENLNDSTFKADRPLVQVKQPTQNTGQLWFQITN